MKSRRKFLSKINVNDIIKRHFDTLVNANTGKAGFDDWFTFFWLPVLLATIVGVTCTLITKEVANTLITILSIFVGLLVNVIVLLFDIVTRNEERTNIKNVVLRETLTNISYTILTSIITIVVSLVTFFEFFYVKLVSSILITFLMAHIFLTFLMIIKRMYALFANEMNEKRKG